MSKQPIPDDSQLPFLIRLLDDPSPEVRESVLHALEEFGPSLESELARLDPQLHPGQFDPIQPLLHHNRMVNLREEWRGWFAIEDDKEMLEAAMTMLAGLEAGELHRKSLTDLLDVLAEDFRVQHDGHDPLALADYLFQKQGLTGASREHYHNPLNSNLVHVIEMKRGIPLSLACIYILVGKRLGIRVEGCNFPGHFLTIARRRGDPVIVDCYNGGRRIDRADLAEIPGNVTLSDIIRLECKAPVIVARALRNLVTAYQNSGDLQSMELMSELLTVTERRFEEQMHTPG